LKFLKIVVFYGPEFSEKQRFSKILKR